MLFSKKKLIRSGINQVVILLTISDIFTWGAYYTISSIAGIYLAERLGADVVKIVGIGSGIYFLSRATLQFPIGLFTDRLRNDFDEIAILLLSGVFMGLPFLLYPFISNQYHYYLLQFIFGLGCSMNLNTWRKLFAKNLAENKEGKAYGFYETVISISTAGLVTLGGAIANINRIYFEKVIMAVGLCMMFGGMWGGMIYFVRNRKTNHIK